MHDFLPPEYVVFASYLLMKVTGHAVSCWVAYEGPKVSSCVVGWYRSCGSCVLRTFHVFYIA